MMHPQAQAQPQKETLIVKMPVKYTIKDYMGVVNRMSMRIERIDQSALKDGLVYLTDRNVWFTGQAGQTKVPLGNVIEVIDHTLDLQALIIKYKNDVPGSVPLAAVLWGAESALSSLKHKLFALTKKKPEIRQDTRALENKLIILLFMGSADMKSLQFFLNIDAAGLSNLLGVLRSRGIVDSMGKLTPEGHKAARTLREAELQDRLGAP